MTAASPAALGDSRSQTFRRHDTHENRKHGGTFATTTHRYDYADRITIDPDILVGKPVITGTRIPVSLILNLIAHERSFKDIIEDYPNLTVDDSRAALAFAQDRVDRRDIFSLAS